MYMLSEKKLLMLRPAEIQLSPNQPRKSFDEYELKLLTDSIRSNGIIQPLSVRKNSDGVYELIAGERRLKAAVAAGLRRVPCVLHKTDDETAALYSIIENLQRSNLTVFEESEGINRLITEYGLSQSEAAARLGIAQSTLSNKLRILKLSDDIKQRIISARLTERHARALLKLPEEMREEALDRIIAEGLTLSQTEQYIEELLNPKKEPETDEVFHTPVRKAAIGDVRLFSNSLTKLVSTLRNAGIDADSKKRENDKYIEFKVRISKNCTETPCCTQLKIC
ncbi:MAG: ParB/RepB/Spo0J family partition protein [Acutalibacteraceae bacterium]|nr:ParB/RepB/Spo0J family partition protein [Acutalibacteraceae bacterium]